MGQTSTVFVYRLLSKHPAFSPSVDEKLVKTLRKKQEIFDAFADKSVAADAQNQEEITVKGFEQDVEEILIAAKKAGEIKE